jgi:hypothetical protein
MFVIHANAFACVKRPNSQDLQEILAQLWCNIVSYIVISRILILLQAKFSTNLTYLHTVLSKEESQIIVSIIKTNFLKILALRWERLMEFKGNVAC